MVNFRCDLHTHTNRSDGADSPAELIRNAAALGMEIIAIADHDVRPPETAAVGDGEADCIAYARSLGVRLVRGIEISCETEIEDTHVIGFGCDWSDPYFDGLEKSVADSKRESYRKLVEALDRTGYPLSWEEVLDNNGAPVAEDGVQKKMIFELMARKKYVDGWNEAKLLVKRTPAFQINRRKPSAASAIREIARTGGVSILAHPYLIADTVPYAGGVASRDEFIRGLFREGLDGIEANYTYDKTSYAGSMTKGDIAREVVERYGALARIVSGGSDYHADHRKGVANARRLGEAGITPGEFDANPLLARLAPR